MINTGGSTGGLSTPAMPRVTVYLSRIHRLRQDFPSLRVIIYRVLCESGGVWVARGDGEGWLHIGCCVNLVGCHLCFGKRGKRVGKEV